MSKEIIGLFSFNGRNCCIETEKFPKILFTPSNFSLLMPFPIEIEKNQWEKEIFP